MAEPGFDFRRLLLTGGVIVVVVVAAIFFVIRGCGPATTTSRKPGYTVIYSNLELKDAAAVIARLKELGIPYEIREEGKAVAVPKDKADQARLGLAEKNLPAGGVVGWEIFNEARLGATDFDRRIQLIRAISGELSRTIRRIEGVEDAWVQVVIPETKLFAATVAPVTASVLLRLRPGFELPPAKINGIVHLVANSVENLQPENVTIVDETGRILTTKGVTLEVAILPPPPAVKVVEIPEEVVKTKEVEKVTTPEAPVSPEVAAVPKAKPSVEVTTALSFEVTPEATKVAVLTPEERILLKAQAKKALEQDLSGKAQELLNRFYPINSVIVRVATEILPAKDEELRAKTVKVKKLKVVILVDNRLDLTWELKQATFTTVAAAVGYQKKRGDRIILQKVPFHLATASPEVVAKVERRKPLMPIKIEMGTVVWWGGAAVSVLVLMWIIRLVRRRREPVAVEEMGEMVPETGPTVARERISALDQVRTMVERNPEKVAELLRSWLTEGGA